MTISKGSNLSITTSITGPESVAAFSSSQAGIAYGKPGAGGTASGFLLDISGTTVTKAGSQADVQTASTSPFQRLMLCPASSSKLLLLGVDNGSPDAEVTVTAITKTATQLSGGTPNVLSFPDNVENDQRHAIYAWDGEGLVVARFNGSPLTFFLTIADDSTQGNVIEFSPATPPLGNIPAFAPLDSTSGIMVYKESSSNDFVGVKLTRTGTTLSAGTPFTIDTKNVDSGVGQLAAAIVDNSGRAIIGYVDSAFDKDLRTIDDTTPNTALVIAASTSDMWLERFHSGSAVAFTDDGVDPEWEEVTIAAGGGLTQTNTVSDSGTGSNSARGAMSRLDNSHIITCFAGSGTLTVAVLTTDVSPPGISSDEFTSAPMVSKPCDINADGDFIYIGAIADDGTPILIKFATALNADGSVVFNPGSGDNIGVECSRVDADEITVAGQFDSPNVVERSEDAGSSFTVIDDGSTGGISAFRVGPDSDDRILVFDEDNSDLLETIDAGTNWTTINGSVTQAIQVIGRLAVDVQQVAFGNSSADAETVSHSMSSGADIEELTGGDDPNSIDVTGLIIN